MTKKKRKRFLNSTKYQRQIMLLAFLPTVMICILMTLLHVVFFQELANVLGSGSPKMIMSLTGEWSSAVLVIMWLSFVVFIYWVCKTSSQLVGSFERIIREMDEVIATGTKKRIKTRIDDELSTALLKRINMLIQGYQKK
ncbi:MAG: hypothetical protein KAR05_11615 [Candidatus Omnitrophica bacterium]|nr:hypothetical protein [Candidatus Omnitrophota bacterium]